MYVWYIYIHVRTVVLSNVIFAGGTQRLSRLVGVGKAKELIFTAKVLNGQEAAQIGLVEHVVSQNGTLDAAYEKALEVAKAIIGNV